MGGKVIAQDELSCVSFQHAQLHNLQGVDFVLPLNEIASAPELSNASSGESWELLELRRVNKTQKDLENFDNSQTAVNLHR